MMTVQQVDITGPRLEGTNPLKQETILPMVIRGVGDPLHEAMMQQGWQGAPVVTIIMPLDPERKKIKGSYYSIHGTFVDTAIKASKVIIISSQLLETQISKQTIILVL